MGILIFYALHHPNSGMGAKPIKELAPFSKVTTIINFNNEYKGNLPSDGEKTLQALIDLIRTTAKPTDEVIIFMDGNLGFSGLNIDSVKILQDALEGYQLKFFTFGVGGLDLEKEIKIDSATKKLLTQDPRESEHYFNIRKLKKLTKELKELTDKLHKSNSSSSSETKDSSNDSLNSDLTSNSSTSPLPELSLLANKKREGRSRSRSPQRNKDDHKKRYRSRSPKS